jgi:hypothetical protein
VNIWSILAVASAIVGYSLTAVLVVALAISYFKHDSFCIVCWMLTKIGDFGD